MTATNFTPHWRQCGNGSCLFRFPVIEEHHQTMKCPRCGMETDPVATILHEIQPAPDHPHLPRITLILDNLRSVFNVGSIFRSSDGCGLVQKIFLCGTTPTPDHPKFFKTSLGSEQSISWAYRTNAYHLCKEYQRIGIPLWSLEMSSCSMNLYQLPQDEVTKHREIALIAGNEVAGIDPDILRISDNILHLPLHGVKESLNVAIAVSITIYHLYSMLA